MVVGGGDASAPSASDLVNDAAAAAADGDGDHNEAETVVVNEVKLADQRSSVTTDAGRGSSVAVRLRTGHFDTDNVKLLRTCSEPDLSRVSRPADKTTRESVQHSRDGSLTDDDVTADVVSCTFFPLLQSQLSTVHCWYCSQYYWRYFVNIATSGGNTFL